MKWFWPLWIFNAIMALIPVGFFFTGIGDGTVSGDNIVLWIGILAIVFLVLWGSHWLKAKNQVKVANVILVVATIPSLIAILFAAMILITNPRWN